MIPNRFQISAFVALLTACGGVGGVDFDAGTQPDQYGSVDQGSKFDFASAVRDLATVDTGTTPDLVPTADLAEARDLMVVDPNTTPDMMESPSQFFIRLSSAVMSYTVPTCGGKLVRVESIALEFENTSTHIIAVKQLPLAGVASVNGGPLVANDLDKAIVSCQFVNDGNGTVVSAPGFVDQMGKVRPPNVILTVPQGKTVVKGMCDLNQIGPAGAIYALGIASAREVVAIDMVNLNDVVPTVDQNLIDNSGANPSVVINVTTDFDPPVITVRGNNPDSVQLGGIYADSGATATDLVDGAIPVVVSGFVNGNQVGVNTVTYTATDKCGNTATANRTVNVVEPFCGLVNENGQMVKADALVSVNWSIITPSGPAIPGFQQTLGIVTFTNVAGSMVCEDVDVKRVVLEFISTFALGTGYIYLDNPWGLPVVTFFPPMRGKFEATFLPRTFELATGQTRRLYIVADTLMAMPADALSVRLGVPVEYVTRISGTSYQTNGQDGLPTIYKTLTY